MSDNTNALGHVNFTKEEVKAAYTTLLKDGGATKQEVIDAINEAGGNDRNLQSATTVRNKLSKAMKARGKVLPAFKRTGGGGAGRATIFDDDFFGELGIDELPDIDDEEDFDDEEEVELE